VHHLLVRITPQDRAISYSSSEPQTCAHGLPAESTPYFSNINDLLAKRMGYGKSSVSAQVCNGIPRQARDGIPNGHDLARVAFRWVNSLGISASNNPL
jgi:hypothetical protein